MRARRSSTSGRTWSAGCGSRSRGPAGRRSRSGMPRCSSTTSWGPAAANRRSNRPLHPERRRGRLRADVHLPRLPLRRGRRVAGRAHHRRDRAAVVVALRVAADRRIRVLRRRCSTSCTATWCGARAATSSTCRPTARSATNGSAGPATSPSSRPPRPTCSTSRTSSRDWLADLAAEQRARRRHGAARRAGRAEVRRTPTDFPPPESTAIWSDAAVWVPWALWQAYGDLQVLRDQFDSMTAHVRRVESLLSPDRAVGHRFPVRRLARPGRAAGRTGRQQGRQRRRRHRLPLPRRSHPGGDCGRCSDARGRPALRRAGRADQNRVQRRTTSTTTARSAATRRRSMRWRSCFGLLDDETGQLAGKRLAELVAGSGYRIQTGFAGTPYVRDALT